MTFTSSLIFAPLTLDTALPCCRYALRVLFCEDNARGAKIEAKKEWSKLLQMDFVEYANDMERQSEGEGAGTKK